MLCHILGFVNGEETGLDGVELTMNKFLRGHDGFRYIEIDRAGKEIVPYRGQEHSASNGNNVRLTIDMGLQNIVEQELDAAIKQFRPKGATVIMMDPKTGAILALANRPNYSLNEEKKTSETGNRLNFAVSAQVEPGSTMKIVTYAGALSEGKITPESSFNCEQGYWEWCKLHDSHPLAELTANDVLVHSSNIGTAKIAMRIGEQKFFEYAHRFGYGERTGIALPGEISGIVRPPYAWDSLSITRMPMGQGITATPLQIVTSMSVIANGGSLMMPQILSEITDADGRVVTSFPPQEVRRVVSRKVTEQVRAALIEVTSKKGTARLAQVLGYTVAGKTGTAQKVVNKVYSRDNKYVTSFVGFMPAEDPAFTMLVLIDEAQTKPEQNFGGLVAAPIFSRIAERAARYLGLPPKFEDTDTVVAKQDPEGRDFRD
jgi:cell division protein FtsI (penicillin-binding protein 3)/stage V sporulation protein D (sporulation-specific penicillin-binding protein)